MKRNFSFYFIILLVFGLLILLVLNEGEKLKKPVKMILQENITSPKSQLNNNIQQKEKFSNISEKELGKDSFSFIKDKLKHPISILILQIIIIIIISRIFGFIAGKIGQPTVIGEIIAGIFLGPSLIGFYFPHFFLLIFPPDSMRNLEILSQIGLVLFMFIIGMELDLKILKLRVKSAIVISHTSIIFAFFFGVCLAYILFERFAPVNTSFTSFALFIGIAMSIAAFPVLARIIQERGLTRTPFGKLIITVAAIDDLTAWCILATIIAFVQAGSPIDAISTILSVIIYILLMLFLVQPLMKKIGSIYISKEIFNKKIIAFVFFIVFLSAFFTEVIGIKALFGGFLAGVIMPQNLNFKKIMTEKIEDLSLLVLLPLFFIYTGLRTQIGLISEADLWSTCGLIILFAIVGKFGGGFIASRVTKLSWKDSVIVGTLMNTRGLMELIVLNIGYDIGILSPQIFTMMVIMTLVTTFMTGPILNFVEYITKTNLKETLAFQQEDKKILKVLISFGNSKMGVSLLKLTYYLSGKEQTNYNISALHLTPHTEITRTNAIKYESYSFAPIRTIANELNIKFKDIYKTTEDVTKEIIKTAKLEKSDLLLIGAAKSAFNKNILGGKVRNIIDQSKCNVGVFIDRNFDKLNNALFISDRVNYDRLIDIAFKLVNNSECKITFMCSFEMSEINTNNSNSYPGRIVFCEQTELKHTFLNKFDLLITNVNNFEIFLNDNQIMLDSLPSLLLLSFSKNNLLK